MSDRSSCRTHGDADEFSSADLRAFIVATAFDELACQDCRAAATFVLDVREGVER